MLAKFQINCSFLRKRVIQFIQNQTLEQKLNGVFDFSPLFIHHCETKQVLNEWKKIHCLKHFLHLALARKRAKKITVKLVFFVESFMNKEWFDLVSQSTDVLGKKTISFHRSPTESESFNHGLMQWDRSVFLVNQWLKPSLKQIFWNKSSSEYHQKISTAFFQYLVDNILITNNHFLWYSPWGKGASKQMS